MEMRMYMIFVPFFFNLFNLGTQQDLFIAIVEDVSGNSEKALQAMHQLFLVLQPMALIPSNKLL